MTWDGKTQHCLMLGAGHTEPHRRIRTPTSSPDTYKDTKWTRLDMNKSAYPDIHFNLGRIESPIPIWNRIPVKDESFDEIHAYQVMEHFGRNGNYKGWFRGFRELWRILKPGGYFVGNSPIYNCMWAWGDPGHTRVICEGAFFYLIPTMYTLLGKAPVSDYRQYVEPYWWCANLLEEKGGQINWALQKLMPEQVSHWTK